MDIANPEERNGWIWKKSSKSRVLKVPMKLKSCHHRSGWKSKLEDEELMVRILKVKELQMMTRSRCSPRGSRLTWRLGW